MTNEYKIENPDDMLVTEQPMVGHPGRWIRDVLLPEYGLNVAELARIMQVNRPNLNNVVNGSAAVSNQLAYKLGALTRDDVADLLINWQHRYTLEQEQGLRQAFRETTVRLSPVKVGEA